MERVYGMFLEALKASLENRKVEWDEEIATVVWLQLFRMAEMHHVLPLIYEAVYTCPAAEKAEPEIFAPFKKRTVQFVMMQMRKTREFLRLIELLRQAGVTPCVVKGIVCRSLYPNPDYRISGDEDVLIPAEQFELSHKVMLEYGMVLAEPGKDAETAYEVSYGKPGSPIYIELHKSLFPPKSDTYGELNCYFKDIHSKLIEVPITGVLVPSMNHTDHFFYLVCHAFKHFLHSGFGIRQVCDIVLYANAYGKKINWEKVLKQCREIRAERFTAALLKIGQKYLNFDPSRASYPECWRKIEIDETALLMDLLESGIYGDASMSRRHSSNITLHAVSANKRGKNAGGSVLKTVFPSAKDLEGRFPYLKKQPYLLPAAWMSRILKYRKETGEGKKNNAAESIKIGNQRIQLLKQYGIIRNGDKVLK